MNAIPLLLIPVVIAHLLVFVGGGLDASWLSFKLPSDSVFSLTAGTATLFIGLLTLFAEVFKATRATRASMLDQSLSLVLFVVLLIEFLLWGAAGNAVFFLLLAMALVDVIAGFAVGLAVARRDIGIMRE
jgi:hypothetical protein